MLTVEEIQLLLKLLGEETVVEPKEGFPYRISKAVFGYRDGKAGALQAKLSILLEVAAKARR